jgi:hypothetical protein
MTAVSEPLAVLRDRVEEQEQELEAAVRELTVAARRSVTPAHWIRARPLLCMSGALAMGFWWGTRRRGRETSAWR